MQPSAEVILVCNCAGHECTDDRFRAFISAMRVSLKGRKGKFAAFGSSHSVGGVDGAQMEINVRLREPAADCMRTPASVKF